MKSSKTTVSVMNQLGQGQLAILLRSQNGQVVTIPFSELQAQLGLVIEEEGKGLEHANALSNAMKACDVMLKKTLNDIAAKCKEPLVPEAETVPKKSPKEKVEAKQEAEQKSEPEAPKEALDQPEPLPPIQPHEPLAGTMPHG